MVNKLNVSELPACVPDIIKEALAAYASYEWQMDQGCGSAAANAEEYWTAVRRDLIIYCSKRTHGEDLETFVPWDCLGLEGKDER